MSLSQFIAHNPGLSGTFVPPFKAQLSGCPVFVGCKNRHGALTEAG